MEVLFWSALGFLAGSIPFAIIITRLARKVDVRDFGDQDPGATNVFLATGSAWGTLAIVLDFLKAALA